MAAVHMNRDLPIIISRIQNGSHFIYADGHEENFPLPPNDFFENICIRNGSSILGRKASFQKLLNVKQKPAILLSERTQQIYFPDKGDQNKDCNWYLYEKIMYVKRIDSFHTEIIFESGFKRIIDLDYRIIKGQMKRCESFLKLINPIDE